MRNCILIILTCISIQVYGQQIPQWSVGKNVQDASSLYNKPIIKQDSEGNIIMVGNPRNAQMEKDILIVKYSPDGSVIWETTYNGQENKDDVVSDFEIDNENNILITGYTTINFEMGYDVLLVNDTDVLTLKYSPSGNLIWAHTVAGAPDGEDYGKALAFDTEGNVYVTGSVTHANGYGNHKVLILKIDSIGSTVWESNYSSDITGDYNGSEIKLVNGEIVVAGHALSQSSASKFVSLKLDTAGSLIASAEPVISWLPLLVYVDDIGNSYLGYGYAAKFSVIKINASGTIAWSDLIPTNLPINTLGDCIDAIIVDSLQNVYVTGRHYGVSPTTDADILTIKYSASGSKVWTNRYQHLSNTTVEIPHAIAVDKNLNVFVAGYSQNTPGTGADFILVKYDVTGQQIGTLRHNPASGGTNAITSFVITENEDIYVTGTVSDIPNFSIVTQKYTSADIVAASDAQLISNSVKVYPNPFINSSFIQIEKAGNEEFSFELYDISGKAVMEQTVNSDQIQINGNNLPAGVYSFKIQNSKRIYTGKIMKVQ